MGSGCGKFYHRNTKSKTNKIYDASQVTEPEKIMYNDSEFIQNHIKQQFVSTINITVNNTLESRSKGSDGINSPISTLNFRYVGGDKDKTPNDTFMPGQSNDIHIDNEPQLKKKVILSYKKGHLIGKGSYGEVYECLNMNTGELLAIKNIKLTGDHSKMIKYIISLKKEISLLKTLNHRNIVKYYTTHIDEEKNEIDIVLEYVSGGSIRQLLDKFNRLDERITSLYTKQILIGLAYLHDNDIIHGDIKGANILIDANGIIKLSDFGCSKKLNKLTGQDNSQDQNPNGTPKYIQGSPYWMAPEIIMKNIQGKESDIWSVGCVVLEMITGIPPWSNITQNVQEVFKLISSGNLPKIPNNISQNCREFILKALKFRPEDRPTALDLFDHSFIRDGPLAMREESNISVYSISQNYPENGDLRHMTSSHFRQSNQSVIENDMFNGSCVDGSQISKINYKESNNLHIMNYTDDIEGYASNPSFRSSNLSNFTLQKRNSKNFPLYFARASSIPITISSEFRLQPTQEMVEEVVEEEQTAIYDTQNKKAKKSKSTKNSEEANSDIKIINFDEIPVESKLSTKIRENQEDQKLELERIKAEKRKKWEEELKIELEKQKQQKND